MIKLKVKDLQKILNTMNPEADLSLYCGGEKYYKDHPLDGIDHYEDGFICFNLSDDARYGIAREVDLEDFKNAIICLDGNCDKVDEKTLYKLMDKYNEKLSNKEHRSEEESEVLEILIYQEAPEIFKEKK